MDIKGIVFDLFHTLTGPESGWSTLPWTCDVLGIDRIRWNELLTAQSRWRLAGEETDPYMILSTLAHQADVTLTEDRIREALRVRTQRFSDSLLNVPAENLEALRQLRRAGVRLGLISNADAVEVAAWNDCPLAGLFDVEVFSCVVGCVKPERAIYDNCLVRLGLSAAECLFVGGRRLRRAHRGKGSRYVHRLRIWSHGGTLAGTAAPLDQ
jgi:putative hydrolase of the HAD superfamily